MENKLKLVIPFITVLICTSTTDNVTTQMPNNASCDYPEKVDFLVLTYSGIKAKFGLKNENGKRTIVSYQNPNLLVNESNINVFDADNINIFWCRRRSNIIYKTSNGKTEEVVRTTLGPVTSISLDWKNRLVYFIDQFKYIRVTDYEGHYGISTIYEINYPGELHILHSLVAVTELGWLFCLSQRIGENDYKHASFNLIRVGTDGSNTQLRTISVLRSEFPPLLIYNYELKMIYWVTETLESVTLFVCDPEWKEYCSYHIRIRQEVIGLNKNSLHMRGLTYLKKRIYWITEGERYVNSRNSSDCPLYTDLEVNLVQEPVYGMVAFYSEKWKLSLPKSNCGVVCSHFCLLYPWKNQTASKDMKVGSVCKCPDGLELGIDKATCIFPEVIEDHCNKSHNTSSTVSSVICATYITEEIPITEEIYHEWDWITICVTAVIAILTTLIMEHMIILLFHCYKKHNRQTEDKFSSRLPPNRREECHDCDQSPLTLRHQRYTDITKCIASYANDTETAFNTNQLSSDMKKS